MHFFVRTSCVATLLMSACSQPLAVEPASGLALAEGVPISPGLGVASTASDATVAGRPIVPHPPGGDSGPVELTDAAVVLRGPATIEVGTSVSGAGDTDADGQVDLIVGAYGDGISDVIAAYLVRGPVHGPIDLSADAIALIAESAGDYAGTPVADAGDTNGDGYDDVLLGATSEGTGGVSAGCAYLIAGPVTDTLSLGEAHAKLTGEMPYDHAGGALAGTGDVNLDGFDDFLVGARYDDGGGSKSGAAYLVHGPVAGEHVLSAVGSRLVGQSEGDRSGTAVAAPGDVDGDGLPDLLVGADSVDGLAGTDVGAAYLVLSPATDMDLDAADAHLYGESAGDFAGSAVAGAGDVDGDGLADLLVGAYAHDDGGLVDAGAAYVVYGPAQDTSHLPAAGATLLGESAGDEAGTSVSGAGDIDGDGFADLLVGADGNDPLARVNAGAAYLILGPVSGAMVLDEAYAKLVGEAPGDRAGGSVAGGPDLTGDGVSNVLIGATLSGPGGAAYVL